MFRYLVVVISLLMTFQTGYADELQVIINGKAIHLDGGDYNENNWGLGLNYDFTPRGKWITFINGSFFKDSNNETSKYIGGGMKRRYQLGSSNDSWYVDAGLIGFLMTRKDFKDNDPFPGILPFVTVGKDWYSMNVTYIPKVSPKHKEILFFQLMFRVAEF